MTEREYQAQLIKKLRVWFPGCIVLKNDPEYLQGVPDLLILHHDMWAMLEVKASASSPVQPNQEFYISDMNERSFAAFIFPENEKDVLNDLQRTFQSRRTARISKR